VGLLGEMHQTRLTDQDLDFGIATLIDNDGDSSHLRT